MVLADDRSRACQQWRCDPATQMGRAEIEGGWTRRVVVRKRTLNHLLKLSIGSDHTSS